VAFADNVYREVSPGTYTTTNEIARALTALKLPQVEGITNTAALVPASHETPIISQGSDGRRQPTAG